MLGSSRKLGGSAQHLVAGNEKRICRLSPHAIERRSKTLSKQKVISVIVRGAKKVCNFIMLFANAVFNVFTVVFDVTNYV